MVAARGTEDIAMAIVYGTAKAETLNALDGVTNGADLIFGRDGNDRIYALGGNDEIWGGGGADYIDGGSGIDTASYSDSATRVWVDLRSGRGQYGAAEGDTLVAIENLTGSAYNDQLAGNDAANVLRGLGGFDLISGYGGDDTIYGGDLGDSLAGQDGEDDLHGDAGNDALDGGAGNDTLHGDAGRDKLIGGNGGDRFIWAVVEDTGANPDAADTIVDFNAAEGDRIDLSAIDANLVASGNQAFTFIGSAPLSGTPGEINFVHSSGDTLIQLQTGTSADPEAVILLPGIHVPEASWFVL
jgi:serralysin